MIGLTKYEKQNKGEKQMAFLSTPFDPLLIVMNLMNTLMHKGIISYDEAKLILKRSMDPSMSELQQERLLDSLLRRVG